MGSCVSFSRSPPAPAADESQSQSQPQRAAAKVVSPDGSMALFAGPVTAREALAPAGATSSSSSPPLFLCSADELSFDAPARALARHEALQPGQLYFALPAPMLRRPLSAKDMAALAVRAATALAAEAGLTPGRSPPRRRRSKEGGAAGARRRRQATARVAPVPVVVSKESQPDGAWKNDVHGLYTTRASATVQDGARTPEKTRKGAGHRSVSRHRRATVQRLSAIAEDGE